jgi:hypothetical protein
MSNDKFKNSPIHYKKAIIDMMDELEPKDMIEVVELLKSKQQKPNKQQTAVEQFLNAIKDQILLSKEHLEMIESYAKKAKEIEKEQHEATALSMMEYALDNIEGKNNLNGKDAFEQYYKQTYGGGNQ